VGEDESKELAMNFIKKLVLEPEGDLINELDKTLEIQSKPEIIPTPNIDYNKAEVILLKEMSLLDKFDRKKKQWVMENHL
jgi:hypothetical protein